MMVFKLKRSVVFYRLLVISCLPLFAFSQQKTNGALLSPIEWSMLKDTGNFYYVNFERYKIAPKLPVGVFDSGTGGLAILNTILTYDRHNNTTQAFGTDGIPDFEKEKFIFLADQANMPYGYYSIENKADLLVEHVFKDVQFLLSDKYYLDGADPVFHTGKKQVKTVVIACNTATAYAKAQIDSFTKKTGVNLKLIGVIDAGAKGVMDVLRKDENASVAVFATVGTIASKGYERTILSLKDRRGFTGQLRIFSQGGYGLAESIDGVSDFIAAKASVPRNDYRGPVLNTGEFKIDRTLLSTYNFDFENNGMLCDSKHADDCSILQINSPVNYLRYHLVPLMEKIRSEGNAPPLKAIVLGCTHYPYLVKELRSVLKELYDFQKDGKYVYRPLMAEHVQLIDPAENVAAELFEYLSYNSLFNPTPSSLITNEFYISVPNPSNRSVELNAQGELSYEYKYGRKAGNIQEYVKVVPFSKKNIPEETIERLQALAPAVYEEILLFHISNAKLDKLPAAIKF
ncbi:MAG: aspartate/glutamate racemase family protein [Bacteroidetes bacterium]|nr:aspartate/glutamate racemase family protein [Bacteroidota bacterium]